MKKLFTSICFISIFAISNGFADHSQKEILIEKIIEAQGDNEKQDVSFIDNLIDKVAERFGNDKEKYKNLFHESFKVLNAEKEQKKADFIRKEYADNFSETELQDIVKLMEDPAIHKLYSKQFEKFHSLLWGKAGAFNSEISLELRNAFLDHAAKSGMDLTKIAEIKNRFLNEQIALEENNKEAMQKNKEYYDKEILSFVISNKPISPEDKKIIDDLFPTILGVNTLFNSNKDRIVRFFNKHQTKIGSDFQKFITIAEAYKDSDEMQKVLKKSIWDRAFGVPLGQFFSSSELKKIEQLFSEAILQKYSQFKIINLGYKVMSNIPLISDVYVKAQIEALKKAKSAGLDEAMINSELKRLGGD